jgi:outer membrane protein OmpA-like peptidoglycan-associated protein
MQKSISLLLVIALSAALFLTGCSASNTVKGGAIGAGAGAIIGAAVGGTAGALIGNYMDRQAEEMQRDIKNAKIERVGEGIKITFDSGILFQTNSSDLQVTAKSNIESLAKILNKYEDTNILIEGHTDSTGSAEYNQALSERRAESVASFAKSLGVVGSRFSTVGYGKTQPVATNTTPEGRQANRRVEVAIFANDKLKDAATKNQIK